MGQRQYVFDNAGDQTPNRFGALETLFDPLTIRHLTSCGVSAGWRCLEIGGGSGSIARWLGERPARPVRSSLLTSTRGSWSNSRSPTSKCGAITSCRTRSRSRPSTSPTRGSSSSICPSAGRHRAPDRCPEAGRLARPPGVRCRAPGRPVALPRRVHDEDVCDVQSRDDGARRRSACRPKARRHRLVASACPASKRKATSRCFGAAPRVRASFARTSNNCANPSSLPAASPKRSSRPTSPASMTRPSRGPRPSCGRSARESRDPPSGRRPQSPRSRSAMRLMLAAR